MDLSDLDELVFIAAENIVYKGVAEVVGYTPTCPPVVICLFL